ncbi:MAG: CdaR family protein [Eubacteriales bacterium]|nr:CdaR family protein [Eubacteriales bacterium]
MKKSLKNNLGLKLLAFLFAFLLWLIVVNIDNPVKSKTFSGIPVIVEHSEVLTEQQKTYQIIDDTQNVNVTVSAKRRILSNIKAEDIVVTADIKEMYLDSQIPLKVTINGYEGNYENAVTNPRNLQIKIEENVSKTTYITPMATGQVRDGYVLGKLQTDPETVTINGPESLVGKISKVVAAVDVSGLAEDSTLESELVLYDEDNNVIDQSRLANNLGNFGVNVVVTLYKTRTVPIHVDTSEVTVKEGYSIASVKLAPEEIEIAGPTEVLNEVESIEVPAEELGGEEIDSRTELNIDLTKYLPKNIQLADSMASSVIVTIALERDGTRNYELPIGSITVKNLDDDLRMSYSKTDNLEVHVKGAKEYLDALDIERIASINLKEYKKAGTYTVPVLIELPEGCSQEGEVEVEIILEKKENGG